ncbi:hypothetical protein PC39_00125 [Salinisphaera sp. PC39]|uniref:synaptic vesicle VAT-1 family membrane protein n=1 Tax=Salinisphaera sp. PC39 TaxID=1304156 RepID=UPI00333FCA20
MRRIVIHRPGGYDRLTLTAAPDPTPGPGEVAIEVAAAGVNFADCITRMGLYASAKALVGYPITPGFEVAGRVAAVGDGVDDLTPGTPVLALTLFGGYATRAVVPRAQAAPVPADWSPAEAAAFPTAFLTAWYALFELAHPRPGARVLVHSVAGGVGQALVQLARLADCEVTGVVGAPHKVAAVAALGAGAVIDKSRAALWAEAERAAPGGFDVILDANGAETLRAGYDHLAPGGKLVVYGFHSMFRKDGGGRPPWPRLLRDWLRTPRFNPMALTGDNKSVLAFNLSFLADRADLLRAALDELLGWAAAGRIRPLPVTAYPFAEVARAHRDLESGQTVGKLVLETGGDPRHPEEKRP